MHGVLQFPKTLDQLFVGYVNTFLKIRQESSGYPKGWVTEKQKRHYVDDCLDVKSIALEWDSI